MDLNEYPDAILEELEKLLSLIDEYTLKHWIETGNNINTISCFRDDIISVVYATAYEYMETRNIKIENLNKEDIQKILDSFKIKI